MFSSRTNWKLHPNKLTSLLKVVKQQGETILDLTESNPTRCHFSYPDKKILLGISNSKNISYDPHPLGVLSARQAIGRYYEEKGFNVSDERIFLTASTSEAYSLLFRLLANPKDRILVSRPSYPLFEFLAQLNDIEMDDYPLSYENGWHIEMEQLIQAIHPETKALVLVNPNNPTGSFIKKEELVQINKICHKKNIALICDEVFSDYTFSKDTKRVDSFVDNRETLTFVLGGISKSLGLPQMKLGWIVANGPHGQFQESSARLEMILDTYLSVNTPVQNSLAGWLKLRTTIQKGIMERLKQNREFIINSLIQFPFCQLLDSEGGWYAIVRIPRLQSEEEWVLEFLKKDRVLVHPGYFFDFNSEAYIVMSLLTPRDVFQEGLMRVLKRVCKRAS